MINERIINVVVKEPKHGKGFAAWAEFSYTPLSEDDVA